jgi:hypothetical protein
MGTSCQKGGYFILAVNGVVKQARQLSLEGRCHGVQAPAPALIFLLTRNSRAPTLALSIQPAHLTSQHRPACSFGVFHQQPAISDHGSFGSQLGRCCAQGMHMSFVRHGSGLTKVETEGYSCCYEDHTKDQSKESNQGRSCPSLSSTRRF